MPKDQSCIHCEPYPNDFAVYQRSEFVSDDHIGQSSNASGFYQHVYRCRNCGHVDDTNYWSEHADPDHDV